MKIDNETEEEIDYNQTGGGGGKDENRAADPCNGSVPAHGSTGPFIPCGRPPWQVTFTNAAGQSCTVPGISRPNTTLTVRSLSDCDIGRS